MWAWHCTSSDFPVASLCSLLPLPPSLPRCLPTRSFSPSPHMPGNQSLKQMWSDCRNASSSQQPYNCAREQMRFAVWGGGRRFRVYVGRGGETAECVSAKITSISLLWGDCRKGPTYLCSEECLSVSDRQEQWRCKRVDNDAFSILQLQNQRQAARGAATRRHPWLPSYPDLPTSPCYPPQIGWKKQISMAYFFPSLSLETSPSGKRRLKLQSEISSQMNIQWCVCVCERAHVYPFSVCASVFFPIYLGHHFAEILT